MTCIDHVSVRVPARHESLELVRRALVRSLAGAEWQGEPKSRVVVAAGEAMANAVEHGSADDALVELEFTVDPDVVTLRVRDEGCDGRRCPVSAPETPPDATSLRGRGLVMMHALADEVEVRPAGRGTEVSLRFVRA
ncbi:MAG: ATP-binding protein [Actinobacteria bacterium]|nr:ATP-binding protein [Actinomycetota bacterium]